MIKKPYSLVLFTMLLLSASLNASEQTIPNFENKILTLKAIVSIINLCPMDPDDKALQKQNIYELEPATTQGLFLSNPQQSSYSCYFDFNKQYPSLLTPWGKINLLTEQKNIENLLKKLNIEQSNINLKGASKLYSIKKYLACANTEITLPSPQIRQSPPDNIINELTALVTFKNFNQDEILKLNYIFITKNIFPLLLQMK